MSVRWESPRCCRRWPSWRPSWSCRWRWCRSWGWSWRGCTRTCWTRTGTSAPGQAADMGDRDVHVGRHLWSYVDLRGKFISRLFLSCWCSTFLWHNPRQLNFQRKATWRCFALSLPLLFQSLNSHEKNYLERFMYWLICEFAAIYLGFCEEYRVVHKNLVWRPVKWMISSEKRINMRKNKKKWRYIYGGKKERNKYDGGKSQPAEEKCSDDNNHQLHHFPFGSRLRRGTLISSCTASTSDLFHSHYHFISTYD